MSNIHSFKFIQIIGDYSSLTEAFAKSLNITKPKENLAEDEKLILELVQGTNKIGDLYKEYQEQGGKGTYKTFQRKIDKLSKGKYIETKKVIGGKEGTTTIVGEKNATLGEFK